MDDNNWLKNIYLDYQNLIYSVAVSIIKDAQLAEDIVQEVFVTLYYKASDIRDKNKIKPWLVRTTVNRAIDYTRRRQKVVTLADDFFDNMQNNTLADPASEMDEKELTMEIHRAIKTLPADMKALVILYYFAEMPQKEIAETLAMPLGTVKTRLRRARLALKSNLQENESYTSEREVCLDE